MPISMAVIRRPTVIPVITLTALIFTFSSARAIDLLTTLVGCKGSPDICLKSGEGREYNSIEEFYRIVAVAGLTTNSCYRISENSIATSGTAWLVNGPYIEHYRSRCLQDVAIRTRNPALCNDVVSVSTRKIDGSRETAELCRRRVENNEQISVGAKIYSYRHFKPALERLGYEFIDFVTACDEKASAVSVPDLQAVQERLTECKTNYPKDHCEQSFTQPFKTIFFGVSSEDTQHESGSEFYMASDPPYQYCEALYDIDYVGGSLVKRNSSNQADYQNFFSTMIFTGDIYSRLSRLDGLSEIDQ